MTTAVFDIECDGLYEEATTVHCIGVQIDGHAPVVYPDVMSALHILDTCDTIVGHNIIGFDIPVLFKLYGWKPKAQIVDTLVRSRYLFPDIYPGHSLEEWGKRIGEYKTDYQAEYVKWREEQDAAYVYQMDDEWVEYNPIMQAYCLQDVIVTYKLHQRFEQELAKRGGHEAADWMEHQFAKDFTVQAMRGVQVDVSTLTALLSGIGVEMQEIEAKVEPTLPHRKPKKGELWEMTPPAVQFKKDGSPSALCLKWFNRVLELEDVGWAGEKWGQWHPLPTPVDENGKRLPLTTTIPMKLKDQEQLKAWLLEKGWVPTNWSFKKAKDSNGKMSVVRGDDGQPVPSQPKLHDKGELCPGLERLAKEFPDAASVVKWVVLRHRRGLLNSIEVATRKDGRVSATGNPCGTPTSRVTHKVVANIPKADGSVLLGKECRGIFTHRPGRILGGVDASGLELRCLAHYIGTQEATDIIVNGDVHTAFAGEYQKVVPSVTRTSGKGVSYSILYGASDKKVGETAGATKAVAKKGKALKEAFAAAIPGLPELMEKVKEAADRGEVKAIDGRIIKLRSKHATLNMLLQSCGSILVKTAQCYMNAEIKRLKLDALQVISYHDEVLLDCKDEETAEKACKLFIEGLQVAGKQLGFRAPLDGELKVGHTWGDVH